jgi:hypothetical protein
MSLKDVLGSSLGTALVTVLVSGGIGGWITHCYQERAAEHALTRQFRAAEYDLNKLWLEKRGDQALTARREYLTTQKAFFEELFAEVAEVQHAAENLVDITMPRWSLQKLRGNALKKKRADRARIPEAFNAAESKWKTNVLTLGIKVGYYGPGDPALLSNWSVLVDTTSAELTCADRNYAVWYTAAVQGTTFAPTASECESQKKAMTAAASAFAGRIGQSTQYAWKGWDNPHELKKALGMEAPRP